MEILEIEDTISYIKLKKIYRDIVKRKHPDISSEKDEILEINEAYDFLRKFIEKYEISVEKILDNENLEQKTFNRFKNDWLGGNFNDQ